MNLDIRLIGSFLILILVESIATVNRVGRVVMEEEKIMKRSEVTNRVQDLRLIIKAPLVVKKEIWHRHLTNLLS